MTQYYNNLDKKSMYNAVGNGRRINTFAKPVFNIPQRYCVAKAISTLPDDITFSKEGLTKWFLTHVFDQHLGFCPDKFWSLCTKNAK